MFDTLTIKELETLRDLNYGRLADLHPDVRRAQVIRHNLDHVLDELEKRLRVNR